MLASEAAEVVRREQDGRTEALELQRPVDLQPEAVAEAAWGEQREREEEGRTGADDDRDPLRGVRAAVPSPDPDEPEGDQDRRPELRRDRGSEQRSAGAVAPGEQRAQAADGESCGPEVEAREHEQSDQERGDGDERQ